jgi:hypothetical protein
LRKPLSEAIGGLLGDIFIVEAPSTNAVAGPSAGVAVKEADVALAEERA